MQVWKWTDQSYQLDQLSNVYINYILLPAWIIIVTLWIEFLCISVWYSVLLLILYPIGLLDL